MVTQLGTGEAVRDVRVTLTGAQAPGVYIAMAQRYSYSRVQGIPMIGRIPICDLQPDACYGTKNNFARDRSPDRVRIRLLIAKMRAAYELSDDAGTSRDIHLEHDKP